MDKQIECLTKSIEEKWIPVTQGIKKEEGADCQCCIDNPGCSGCPIFEDTENINCRGTPYVVFSYLSYNFFRDQNYDLMFDLKAAAQMELEYLVDLKNRLIERGEICK